MQQTLFRHFSPAFNASGWVAGLGSTETPSEERRGEDGEGSIWCSENRALMLGDVWNNKGGKGDKGDSPPLGCGPLYQAHTLIKIDLRRGGGFK